MKSNDKGFTLVELLVVIAIIGILCILAIPSLLKAIDKAKAADIEADISAIRSTIIVDYAENSTENLTDCGKVTGNYSKKQARDNNKLIATKFDISGLGDNAVYQLKRNVETDTGKPIYTLTIDTPNTTIAKIVESNLNGLATDINGRTITVELLDKPSK